MSARRVALVILIDAFLVASAAVGPAAHAQSSATFVRQHDWDPSQGLWLKADTHVHTQFSDGSWALEELVAAASEHGCDVIALTDHADRNLSGASEEYFAAVRRARREHPEMIVLAGLEWNVPPHDGDEHACVLIEPTADEAVILAEFKEQFDDLSREPHAAKLALEALQWLEARCAATNTLAVVFYNHPGRKRRELDSFRDELVALRSASPLLAGFEGGVGHQAGQPLGAYEGAIQLDERWDPSAATVGGVWDQALQRGIDVWGALSTSDFHNDQGSAVRDFPPGRFSETWIDAADRTPRDVLRALAGGSFFGAQGHIVRQVELTVTAAGLPRPACAGESIRVPAGETCRVSLRMEVPRWDWQDVANKIDVVEFVAIDADGARVLARFDQPASNAELDVEIRPPAGGMVVRARGRREVFQRPDYLFMTNSIRVLAN